MEPESRPTSVRQWRPAAQRNLRNKWSRLLAARNRWPTALAEGKSAATSLVNAYLSRRSPTSDPLGVAVGVFPGRKMGSWCGFRYLPAMDLGVLKDMPGIRAGASRKLSCKQELSRAKLVSSYKSMVEIISDLIKASASMRCYLKGSGNSSLIQFSNYPEDENDLGDGGGIPVFSSWSIKSFEQLAQELVEMFVSELYFKDRDYLCLNCLALALEMILKCKQRLCNGHLSSILGNLMT